MFRKALCLIMACLLVCTAGCVTLPQGDQGAAISQEQSKAGTDSGKPEESKSRPATLSGLLAKAEYPKETEEFIEIDKDFQDALERFCSKTARDLLNSDENTIYSPISLFYALALLTEGASQTTADELYALLEMQDIKDMPNACNQLFRLLYQDNERAKLRIANSLWMKEGFPFEESYLNTAKDDFFASVYAVDFMDPATGKLIGDWVNENTGGLVPYEYNPDPNQVLSIINTIWLKSLWDDAFLEDLTGEDAFYLKDGRAVMTDFMHRRPVGTISIGENYRRSDLYLSGTGYVTFILPDEGVDILSLMENQDTWDEALHGGNEYHGRIIWSVPKIKQDSKLDLTDYLAESAPSAFSVIADFARMTPESVCVSYVLQKAHVEWDEKGVEAAAYTEIGMKVTAMPPQNEEEFEMNLNRPFVYIIRSFNGTMLFCGICNEP